MYHAIIFILEVFFIISCVHFWGCLLILSIFDVQRATASKYWIEFHQKSIAAVRCSLAYVLRWRVTSLRNLDSQEGHTAWTRYRQRDHWPLDNIGQFKTILFNAWKYQEIFNNIGQYLNILKIIITTQNRESWNSHLKNIEKY